MGLESAVTPPTLRERVVQKLSPDEIEFLRSRLYEDAPRDPHALKLLQALPPREASERTPESKQLSLPVDQETAPKREAYPSGFSKQIGAPLYSMAREAIPKALNEFKPQAQPDISTDEQARLASNKHQAEYEHADPETQRRMRGEQDNPLADDLIGQQIVMGLMTAPAFAGARALGGAIPAVRALANTGRIGRTVVGAGEGALAGDVVARATGADPNAGRLLGAAGGALGEQSAAIRDPRSETGQIIQDLGRVGARPGVVAFERPAVGGAMDTPEYRALPRGEAGDLELAVQAQRAINQDIETRFARAKGDIGSAERRAMIRHGAEPQDTTDALMTLEDVMRRNTANETPINPALNREAGHYSNLLTHREDFPEVPPGETYEGFPTEGQPAITRETPEVPFRELVNIKKGLREATEPGQPGTLENAPARRLMGELKDLATGVDPRYDAAAGRYGREMGQLERTNDVLVGKNEADYADSAARERAMVRNLRTAGRNRADERLPQLREIADTQGQPYSYINTLIARNAMKVGKLQPQLMPGMSPLWTALRTAREAGHAVDLRLVDPLSRAARSVEPFYALPLEAIQHREENKK